MSNPIQFTIYTAQFWATVLLSLSMSVYEV